MRKNSATARSVKATVAQPYDSTNYEDQSTTTSGPQGCLAGKL
jgi:hypothetical protein